MGLATALMTEADWNKAKKEYGIPDGAGKVSIGKLLAAMEKAADSEKAGLADVIRPLNVLSTGLTKYKAGFAANKKVMALPKSAAFLKEVVDAKLVNGCKQLRVRMENCVRVFPRVVEGSTEALKRALTFQTMMKRPLPPTMSPANIESFNKAITKELAAMYGLVTAMRSAIEESKKYHPNTMAMNFLMASVLEVNKLIQQGEKTTLGAKLAPKDSKAAWLPYIEKMIRNIKETQKLAKNSQ